MTAWRTAYQLDGRALVYARERVTLELQLQAPAAGGSGPYEDEVLDGRAFVQRVIGKTGQVLAEAAGEIVEEDGDHFIRFVLDGDTTADLLPAGKTAADLRHVIHELLDGGDRDAILAPTAFAVRLADDPDALPPGAPPVDIDGPAARFTVQRGPGRNRLVVTQRGARGPVGPPAAPVVPEYVTDTYRLITSADFNKQLIQKNGSGADWEHDDPADYPTGYCVFWKVQPGFPGMIRFRDHLGGTGLLFNVIGAFETSHSGADGRSEVIDNADLSGKLWQIHGLVA